MIFNIGSSPSNKTPVLDASYPQNVSVTDAGTSTTLSVVIAEEGRPNEYTYQWYYDGSAVSGATSASYTRTVAFGSHTAYCVVTNKAGSVTSRTATLKATKEYLYKAGDACTSVTGGWVAKGMATYSGITAKAPSLTKNSTNMRATLSSLTSSGLFRPSNTIDLSKYSTLKIDLAAQPKMWNYIWIVVYKSSQTYLGTSSNFTANVAAKVQIANHTTGADFDRKTYSINVSSLSGSYVVGVFFHHSDTSNTMGVDFYNMWGE